ncbi:MAG: glycoside hydrolase domain-containing protein [Armatimonadota bacterium]
MSTSMLVVLLPVALTALLASVPSGADDVPYTVASWKAEGLGNHRVRLWVEGKAEAVWAHIEWRRRDLTPEKLETIVVEAASGKRVTNVVRADVNREFGDVVFEAPAAGEYFVYFMPYTESFVNWNFQTRYLAPDTKPDPVWVERNGLAAATLAQRLQSFPQAKVLAIQARSEFDRFDPMEVIATATETEELIAQHSGEPYLLFAEDRRYPVRMTDDLPLRWIRKGISSDFSGTAQRGEYYVFQVGVYAAREAIAEVKLAYSDLRTASGKAIPASAFHCINLGGTDWLGRVAKKTVAVPRGKVQALWIGVQVPADATAAEYAGTITVKAQGAPDRKLGLRLTVSPEVIADHGDNDLWRMSRLRWLDSTIGLDEEVAAPYTPLKVNGETLSCLGRELQFKADGLPQSVKSNGREVLAAPATFTMRRADLGEAASVVRPAAVTHKAPGVVTLKGQGSHGFLTYETATKMEADGYLTVATTVTATKAVLAM